MQGSLGHVSIAGPAHSQLIRRRVGSAGGAYLLVGGMGYLDRKKTTLRVYLWMRVRFVSRMVRRASPVYGAQRLIRQSLTVAAAEALQVFAGTQHEARRLSLAERRL